MGQVFPINGRGFDLPRMHGMEPRSVRAALGNVTDRDAIIASEAPRIPWDMFYREFVWKQGDHVALIGPTGGGKTTLLIAILPLRSFVAVASTKPRDATMDYLISTGYTRFPEWGNYPATRFPRRVIWPDASRIDSEETQRRVFHHMYASIYREGGWAIVIDEGYTISETLGLKKEMRQIWTQGRSLGITHIVTTQRPRWIPLEMYDQSTHLFFWQNQDTRSLDILGDINGRNPALVKGIIAHLDTWQVLYVNSRTGEMLRTTPPPPGFDTTGVRK